MQSAISLGTSVPITERIRRHLADSIVSLGLPVGARLTPPGELASQIAASPAAVRRAYRALEADGLCRWRNGAFEVAPVSLEQRRERARRHKLAAEGEALLRELELARSIQRELLPPPFVKTRRYAIAARVQPAGYVSGDFYDILPRGHQTVDLVLADVSGSGIGASLIMASVKAILPSLPGTLQVTEALRHLNRRLCAILGRRQFVALAYARFNGQTGTAELANAGLPDAYVLRRGQGPRCVEVPGPRLPLGVRPGVEYQSQTVSLEAGQRLLLYTDGLPEAPAGDDEPLGYERLVRLLGDAGPDRGEGSALESWLDGLMLAVDRLTDGRPADDRAALALEILDG